ncbi:hypothetical protein [Terasakiella brassicae]|nr:hypothetical protein [Terasakiella brassicae]
MRDWFGSLDWGEGIAVTLTFPPKIAAVREAVEGHLKHFWNVADGEKFGNLSKRQTRPYRIQRVCCIEAGANQDNYHCHAMVKVSTHPYANPDYTTVTGMLGLLEKTWFQKMTFNVMQPTSAYEFSPITTSSTTAAAWHAYMTKKVTDWNTDALCLKTSWLSDGQSEEASA